ncbi:hypothetical protein LPB072_11830 [Hydrogenophaga crassostreae]|nr:hypothetical protein LPB072_11830 [Hydrogenophaga crassostreae]
MPCSVPFKLDVQWAARQLAGSWVLQISYAVVGEVRRLRLPSSTRSSAADGLWAHTCFEAFFSESGTSAYREFNFSPSTQWAHYRFTNERTRDPIASGLKAPTVQAPITGTDRLVLTATLAALPSSSEQAGCLFAPTAVLELDDGSLSYWAPSHLALKPDFHSRAGWTIPLAWSID